jgi:O-antigen/teichoic acid export membrane protein
MVRGHHAMNRTFFQSVSVLMLGSGAAQVIALACAPVLTRLYAPDDYAALTVFLAITGVLLPFICGKYEVAVVTASTDREAASLIGLCLRIAVTAAIALLVPAILGWKWINWVLGSDVLGRWLLAVPLAVVLGAVAMVGRYAANRRSAYGLISRYLVLQAMLSVGMNVALGLAGWGSDGLLVANLVSVSVGTFVLLLMLKPDMSRGWSSDWPSMKMAGWKYRDFPIYNASSTALDSLTQAMPVFFIARLTSDETLGSYGFMMRVAWAPLSLIGGAVTQVHLKHLSQLVYEGEPALGYLIRIALLLVSLVVVPTLVLVICAPAVFEYCFGAPWRHAGELLAILMPSIAVQFVVSTLSPACGVTGHNKLGAAWKVIAFGSTLLMFWTLAIRGDVRALLPALAALNVALYVLYFVAICFAVTHPRPQHR